MNSHYKHHYDRSTPVVVVVHKLDSLCTFSDAFYTCRFSVDFKHFQLLTPNFMRLVITLKMLNMTIKIIPDTFFSCKMTLDTHFQRVIVLFPSGKCSGRAKQAHTPQHIVCYDHHKAYVMCGARLVLTQHKYWCILLMVVR